MSTPIPGRRLVVAVPRLVGRVWNDVTREVEDCLRRLSEAGVTTVVEGEDTGSGSSGAGSDTSGLLGGCGWAKHFLMLGD